VSLVRGPSREPPMTAVRDCRRWFRLDGAGAPSDADVVVTTPGEGVDTWWWSGAAGSC
jgi:hypothetical protein